MILHNEGFCISKVNCLNEIKIKKTYDFLKKKQINCNFWETKIYYSLIKSVVLKVKFSGFDRGTSAVAICLNRVFNSWVAAMF